ncbi:apoptosis regulatory protein Siva [Alligator mississippiensis]|uniref:Apoptosis regulatory protein Siva n=1 Tax=Alligator mississippiensis TaxID=8496 RepID=A0A151M234_ALLMI|nr:apoptosis regulatory protein Siva [Alligator mississippiensis]
MPKRRCPFAEAAAPQRKTRVGLREMSRGVAGDTYRRQVYALMRHRSNSLACTAPPMGVSKACSSCIRTVDIKEVCTQCDHLICQHCSKLCSCCNTVICSMCCTIDYSDVGDQVLCSGCSMFEV